jgi:hypothetical protein
VNERPLVRSGLRTLDSFEFRKDSAGLGVPRDTLGKLDKISDHTLTHGTATTQVFVSAPNAEAGMNGRAGSGNTAMLGATIHRGVAPPSMSDPSSSLLSAGAPRTPVVNNSPSTAPMPASSSHPVSSSSGGHPR